jgi:hypothetical protein
VQNVARVQGKLLKGALDRLQRLADRSGSEPAESTNGSTDGTTDDSGVRNTAVQVVKHALAGVRELAEAGYRAQAETLAVVSRRLQQDLEEATARLQPRS